MYLVDSTFSRRKLGMMKFAHARLRGGCNSLTNGVFENYSWHLLRLVAFGFPTDSLYLDTSMWQRVHVLFRGTSIYHKKEGVTC